ncbi:hypothetical protein [Enemella evansiae]|uniref:hypothetical protein n=1 Tax=Enemella evansiae TaxID=2016499 RepID=UPI001181098F|nr:hypothetical protein [Enemella evansiae]
MAERARNERDEATEDESLPDRLGMREQPPSTTESCLPYLGLLVLAWAIGYPVYMQIVLQIRRDCSMCEGPGYALGLPIFCFGLFVALVLLCWVVRALVRRYKE